MSPRSETYLKFEFRGSPHVVCNELNWGYGLLSDEKGFVLRGFRSERVWAECSLDDGLIVTLDDSFFGDSPKPTSVALRILLAFVINLREFAEVRLVDFRLSEGLKGIFDNRVDDVRREARSRNLVATVIKPYSMTRSEKVELARKFSRAGGDYLKEDETSVFSGNHVLREARDIQEVMSEHGSFYVPNVTGLTVSDIHNLLKAGVRYGLLTYLLSSFREIPLLSWAHRAGVDLIQGITPYAAMKLAALIYPIVHVGTPPLSDLKERLEEVKMAIKEVPFVPVFSKVTPRSLEILAKEPFVKILLADGFLNRGGRFDEKALEDLLSLL